MVTIHFWGDEGELCYPKSKDRHVVDLLTRPVLTMSDPSSYILLAIPRPGGAPAGRAEFDGGVMGCRRRKRWGSPT